MADPMVESPFPTPSRSAGALADPARNPDISGSKGNPAGRVPMEGNPAQGDHRGAGGRAEHHLPDGGIGTGNKAPFGWPAYKQPD